MSSCVFLEGFFELLLIHWSRNERVALPSVSNVNHSESRPRNISKPWTPDFFSCPSGPNTSFRFEQRRRVQLLSQVSKLLVLSQQLLASSSEVLHIKNHAERQMDVLLHSNHELQHVQLPVLVPALEVWLSAVFPVSSDCCPPCASPRVPTKHEAHRSDWIAT